MFVESCVSHIPGTKMHKPRAWSFSGLLVETQNSSKREWALLEPKERGL